MNPGIAYKSLALWFNLEIYGSLMENVLGSSTIITLLRYSAYLLLSLWLILIKKGLFKKKVGLFIMIFLFLIFINLLFASWKKYVLVEAVTSLIMAIPAFLIISDIKFDARSCLLYWYPFCILNTILLAVVFVLYKIHFVSYGMFSTITYSNIIVLWFLYIKGLKKNVLNLVMILVNNFVGIIWGSRMPALAALILMFFMWLFMTGKSKRCKVLWLFFLGSVLFFVLCNVYDIIECVIIFLDALNISSRSLEKLFYDLQNNVSLLAMMESSGRDYIWKTVFEFLKSNFILPHGFGFVRYLTQGRYYYSHNILTDFLILGGVFSFVFILIFGVKAKEYKKREGRLNWEFLLSILFFFLVRAITGAYFINDKYAILVIALVFFSMRENNETEKK